MIGVLRFYNAKTFSKRGFSLLELMVTIIILGILITAALSYYGSTTAEARRIKIMQDLEGLKNSIKIYATQNGGQYPPNIEALVGKYIPEVPRDPWGQKYKIDTAKLEVYCIPINSTKRISVQYGFKD